LTTTATEITATTTTIAQTTTTGTTIAAIKLLSNPSPELDVDEESITAPKSGSYL